jgi:uncharacterized protein
MDPVQNVNLSAAELALLQRCKAAVRRIAPGATVILYGSRARGQAELASDYDLLVLTGEPVPAEVPERIGDALYEIEIECGVVISEFVIDRGEWDGPHRKVTPLHENVEREGILL